MTGHDVELLGNLPALNRDGLTLLTERRRARHQRPQFLFQTIHRLDRTIYKHRDRDHRSGDHDKRDRDDRRNDNQPEQWIVSVHSSKNSVLCTRYFVLCFRRFEGPFNSTRQSTKLKAPSTSCLTLPSQAYRSAQLPCGRKVRSCASPRRKLVCPLPPRPEWIRPGALLHRESSPQPPPPWSSRCHKYQRRARAWLRNTRRRFRARS